MITKPLLAGKAPDDLTKLRYPVMVSIKLDGIRCLTLPPTKPGMMSRAVTRTLKPIPNAYVREEIETNIPPGFDGELMLPQMNEPFREVSSAIMSREGKPDFRYCVFDLLNDQGTSFENRYTGLQFEVLRLADRAPWLYHLRHWTARSPELVQEFMARSLEDGFEGVMLRDPAGAYKFGRSTVREQILLKVKNWADEEATVIGLVEQMHNQNELQKDELGHAKRSTAKGGLVPAGTLGALRCRFDDGTEFEVGTGFTAEQRQEIWDIYHEPMCQVAARGVECWPVGHLAKIKHQPDPGGRQPGQAPRFPVFLGWRQD